MRICTKTPWPCSSTTAGSVPRRRSKRKSRPESRPKLKGWPGSSLRRKCQPRHSLRRKCAPECKPRQTRPQSQASCRSWAKSRPRCKAGRNSAQGSTARWIVDPLPPPVCLLLKRRKPPRLRSWSRGVHLIISMRTYTFTSGFFSPNFSLSISQISLRALPCFSMLLIVL